jgi:hypothetical protein
MRTLVSIPVHEEPEVVRQQLRNILDFFEDPVVVLHVSRGFDVDPESLLLSPRILLNSERFATGWGTGICAKVHLSNLQFARNRCSFDYAVLASSNELYVRRGLEAHMSRFLAGSTASDFSGWGWRYACMLDRPLRRSLRANGISRPQVAQLEGSFFRADILDRMLQILEPLNLETPWAEDGFSKPFEDWPERPGDWLAQIPHRFRGLIRHLAYQGARLPFGLHVPLERLFPRISLYPREEVYFPTALMISGVKSLSTSLTFVNWQDKLRVTLEDVEAVRAGGQACGGRELFSVKRVSRELGDPLRKYIATLGSVW